MHVSAKARRYVKALADVALGGEASSDSGERVMNELDSLSAFGSTRRRILEIGAGTGRYLEQTLKRCSPEL